MHETLASGLRLSQLIIMPGVDSGSGRFEEGERASVQIIDELQKLITEADRQYRVTLREEHIENNLDY